MLTLLKKTQLIKNGKYSYNKYNQYLKCYLSSKSEGDNKQNILTKSQEKSDVARDGNVTKVANKNKQEKKKNATKEMKRHQNNGKNDKKVKKNITEQKEEKETKETKETKKENETESRICNSVLYFIRNNFKGEQRQKSIEEFKQEVKKKFLKKIEMNNKIEKNVITDTKYHSIISVEKKEEMVKFMDLYSILFLCYKEKITDFDLLQKLSNAFDIFYKQHPKELFKKKNIIYYVQLFFFFSYLNINNEILNKKIKQYIINSDEINPLLIYKYLECLYLLTDEKNNVTSIIEIVIDNITKFNNYFLIHILHFLYDIKYIDKEVFSIFTKKINNTVYTSKANYFDLIMLASTYALYKKENITFFNYLYRDITRSINTYEDTFNIEDTEQNEEKQEKENREKKSETKSEESSKDKPKSYQSYESHNIESNTLEENTKSEMYLSEIENVNRKNYIYFSDRLHNDALKFYSFFVTEQTTNRNNLNKMKLLHMNFTPIEEDHTLLLHQETDKNVSTEYTKKQLKWNEIFFNIKEKNEELTNEPFLQLDNIKNKEDKMKSVYKWMKTNISCEFHYTQLVDILNHIGTHIDEEEEEEEKERENEKEKEKEKEKGRKKEWEKENEKEKEKENENEKEKEKTIIFPQKDNIHNNIYLQTEKMIETNTFTVFRKNLLFIDSYYIGHLFHIIDSMLQLKIHINCKYFETLKKKVEHLLKYNEKYIINNFDSVELKNVLLFLVYTNRNYKIEFLYAITHKIVDLYINNLCNVKTLATFLYNLLPFTKQKCVKKNKFQHTIRTVVYNTQNWEWLHNNKKTVLTSMLSNKKKLNSSFAYHTNQSERGNTFSGDSGDSSDNDDSNTIPLMRVKNYSLLQLLALHICKNVYFIKLSILCSLLRSFSYLAFPDVNFYHVFIPLFFKHMSQLQNPDILNITQAYNKQKIKNKYLYYLLSKQYQLNHSKKEKNDNKEEPEITLIG